MCEVNKKGTQKENIVTPEEIEAILQSNSKAIASNSSTIAECRREISALYGVCKELAQNSSELARDRAVMFEIIKGFNEERTVIHETLADIAENVAKLTESVVKLTENK